MSEKKDGNATTGIGTDMIIANNENNKSPPSTPSPPPSPPPTPYSIYTTPAKRVLVLIVATAGLFSPLPANIYFPAIPTLSHVFHRPVSDINLTVTIYLAMQGISPMLWGPLSDRYGRRPSFLICLSILTASSVGLALCPTDAFWLLLLLRAVQAGGCASTISLGAGVIGDVAGEEERGGYFGWFNLGPMLAPCIGPAVGGGLSEGLGWRSVFWFLAGGSAVCLVLVVVFLPETMRALVGNGGGRQPGFPRGPLWGVVGRMGRPRGEIGRGESGKEEEERLDGNGVEKAGKRRSANPFRLLIYPDIALTLVYTGIVYAVNYTITSTISSSFTVTYPYLSESLVGICYLSTGVGMVLGSTITGKLLDRDYARLNKVKSSSGSSSDLGGDETAVSEHIKVPIEYARLRMSPALLLGFVASVIGWGWCIQAKTSIAGPLVLQVILGYTSIAILNSTMTLMIDIIRDQSSGVIACTNLVRCSLAALLVALIDKATFKLGYGWTYTLLGGLCSLLILCIYTEIRKGPKWRAIREDAAATKQEEQQREM